MAIYVICPDHGSEGLGEPICAAEARRDAEALYQVMTKGSFGPNLRIIAVPEFPNDFPEKTQ